MRAFESRWVSVATMPALFAVIVLASLTKLGDAAAARPDEPRVEQRDGLVGAAVEDEPELLFEEVGAVEAAVDVLDRRELRLLAFGQPFGSLPERPAGAFEPAGAGRCRRRGGPRCQTSRRTSSRALAGERDDVVGSRQSVACGQRSADRAGDPLAQVARDELDPAGALGAELVEEPEHGLLVAALPRPDQPAACRGRRRR